MPPKGQKNTRDTGFRKPDLLIKGNAGYLGTKRIIRHDAANPNLKRYMPRSEAPPVPDFLTSAPIPNSMATPVLTSNDIPIELPDGSVVYPMPPPPAESKRQTGSGKRKKKMKGKGVISDIKKAYYKAHGVDPAMAAQYEKYMPRFGMLGMGAGDMSNVFGNDESKRYEYMLQHRTPYAKLPGDEELEKLADVESGRYWRMYNTQNPMFQPAVNPLATLEQKAAMVSPPAGNFPLQGGNIFDDAWGGIKSAANWTNDKLKESKVLSNYVAPFVGDLIPIPFAGAALKYGVGQLGYGMQNPYEGMDFGSALARAGQPALYPVNQDNLGKNFVFS